MYAIFLTLNHQVKIIAREELFFRVDYLNEAQIGALIDKDEDAYDKYAEKMEISKIGGNPFFIQSEEIPIQGEWKFLCQLHEECLPVWVNFGTGVAYVFLDEKGTFGKLLWQC